MNRKRNTMLIRGAAGFVGLVLLCGTVWAQAGVTLRGKPLARWLRQIQSSNPGLRMRAARVLRGAPEAVRPQVIQALIPILSARRESVRFVAAQVLGEYGPAARSAVPHLVALLKGTQFERNRAAAAKALGQILRDAKPSKELDKVVAALTAKFNEEYDSSPDVRREAVRALGMIGPAAKACIPKLVRALKDYRRYSDAHFQVRRQAAWTCGRMGPLAAQHMDLLVAMMQGEGQNAPEIVEAIGKIGPVHDNVVPNIVDKMEKCGRGYLGFRLKALETLAKFGPKSAPAVPFLMRILREKHERKGEVAALIGACRALGKIGPAAKDALPLLRIMTTYKCHPYSKIPQATQEQLHKAAKEAIAAITGQPKSAEKAGPGKAGN